MNEHPPIVSEFASDADAAAYQAWLADKVAASLADRRAPVAHDEAMARVRKRLKPGSGAGEA